MLDEKAACCQLSDIRFKRLSIDRFNVLGQIVSDAIYVGKIVFGEVISECINMQRYYLPQSSPIHSMLFPAPSLTQAGMLLRNQRFATFREFHYAITILLEKVIASKIDRDFSSLPGRRYHFL